MYLIAWLASERERGLSYASELVSARGIALSQNGRTSGIKGQEADGACPAESLTAPQLATRADRGTGGKRKCGPQSAHCGVQTKEWAHACDDPKHS